MPHLANLLRRLIPFLLLLHHFAVAKCFTPASSQVSLQRSVSGASNRQRILAENSTSWNTLSGGAPLVIARGGSSGLFPDQTFLAYVDALNNSLSEIALFCDLQLTNDSVGICRTGIDLQNSTNIAMAFPNSSNTYMVNGNSVSGYFSIDFSGNELLSYVQAVQPIQSRSPVYDGYFPIFQPVNVTDTIAEVGLKSLVWLNVEFASFFEEHHVNMTSYILSAIKTLQINYISSPEVSFLKGIQTAAHKSKVKLIFRLLDVEDVEPTTNVTYGSWLKDLKNITGFASGILVPKNLIWSINNQFYLESETTLVQDAHAVGLEVYASGFANDAVPVALNYSFNPIEEYLQFLSGSGAVVDGVLTDFPVTASESLACYTNNSAVSSSKVEAGASSPLIISHNGASGDYPGCTLLAYQGAVKAGASYIDCPVQMTKDGIPICREFPDLLKSTDISSHTEFFPSRLSSVPQLQTNMGIFTFNLTLKEIDTLKAIMYSPEASYGLTRNQAYNSIYGVMTLSDFLNFAKNISNIGILIDIQDAYFLQTTIHLDVVGTVIATLDGAGYQKSNQVLIQSEDSSVLQRFQQLTPYRRIYRVDNESVSFRLSTIQEIKQMADIVALPRLLIAYTYEDGFLANGSSIVREFQAQNISVFISYLRNEFVALAFDYQADPTLEINTMAQFFKVNGIVTDFPATSRAYLDNSCRTLKTQAGGEFDYSMRLVIPGDLLQTISGAPPPIASEPLLPVSQPALPPTVISPVSPTGPSSSGPATNSPGSSTAPPSLIAPGPSKPSAGSRTSASHLLALFFSSLFFVI